MFLVAKCNTQYNGNFQGKRHVGLLSSSLWFVSSLGGSIWELDEIKNSKEDGIETVIFPNKFKASVLVRWTYRPETCCMLLLASHQCQIYAINTKEWLKIHYITFWIRYMKNSIPSKSGNWCL